MEINELDVALPSSWLRAVPRETPAADRVVDKPPPPWGSPFVVEDEPPRAYREELDVVGDYVLKPAGAVLAGAGALVMFALGCVISLAILAAVVEFVVWVL
jgi:hypothetical protein